jgi:hypothetical protein
VGNTSRTRARIYGLLVFLVAILVGIGTYVLVVTIFYTPHDKTKYEQNLDKLGSAGSNAQPSPPTSPPCRAFCWKYEPSEVTVGEASAIKLRLTACDGGDLPRNTTVRVILTDPKRVALSGPSETERTPTSQSWEWMASAHATGDSEVFFLAAGTGSESTVIPENITARDASASPGQTVATAVSTAGPWVQTLAGAIGAVVVALITFVLGPIVTNRLSRAKPDQDQAVQPPADNAPKPVEEPQKAETAASKAVQ